MPVGEEAEVEGFGFERRKLKWPPAPGMGARGEKAVLLRVGC